MKNNSQNMPNYFGRPLIMNKSIYGMTNTVKVFADELTNLPIDYSGFKQSQCKMFIYYKYATYGPKLVVLSYFD